jgi:hypothetical protein
MRNVNMAHPDRASRHAISQLSGIFAVRGVGRDTWLSADPQTEVGSDPLTDVPCLPELPKLIRLKYSTQINPWTRLTAAVDRLQTATDGQPRHSLVWRELLSGYKIPRRDRSAGHRPAP